MMQQDATDKGWSSNVNALHNRFPVASYCDSSE